MGTKMVTRYETKVIQIGNLKIGGGNPIAVQSMTNVKTKNVDVVVEQIHKIEQEGGQIVRFAVPDMESAKCIDKIKERVTVPLVADIHFDYRLALEAIDRGIDKVRLNPGNIGSFERVREVAKRAKVNSVPIRIGINGGSLERDIAEQFRDNRPEGMVESARRHIEILEQCDFDDIVVSLKASDIQTTVQAYRLFAERYRYPLHIGVTEAGTAYEGLVKSSVGIGSLLLDGLGDTIRVSLTAPPQEEIPAGIEILKACGLYQNYIRLISCPTCARCNIDLIPIANAVSEQVRKIHKDLTVAVMGCAVNGPGEARGADIGIAGGDGCALLFKKGEIVRKLDRSEIVPVLLEEIKKM